MCLRCTELVLSRSRSTTWALLPPRELMTSLVSQLSPWAPPTLLGIQLCVPGPHPHSQARSHTLVVVLANP